MSRLTNTQNNRFNAALLTQLGSAAVKLAGTTTASAAKGVASLESASPDSLADIQNSFQSVSTTLKAAHVDAARLADRGQEACNPSVAGLEAASIVMMGTGSLKTDFLGGSKNAMAAAIQTGDISLENFSVRGMNYSTSKSLESFGEADVDSHSLMSVSYNFSAPQQDEFAETFYPVVVGTPDQVYWRIAARRPSVTYGAQHTADGTATKYQKTNLLDAFRDHTVLENEDTRIVPFLNPDNSNDAHFIAAGILDTSVSVRGVEVPTRPLAFNALNAGVIDIKGLASHPDLIKGGLLTHIDKIDTGTRLSYLVLKVVNGVETNYIRIGTEHVQGNNFNQVREGMAEEQELRFRQNDFVLNCAAIKDVTGAAPSALAAATTAELSLSLKLGVDGELHLESGELAMSAKAVRSGKVIDATGAEVTTSAFDGVTFSLEGFGLNGRFLNAGRRVVSLLLDSDELARNFYVPTIAPISLQRIATEETAARDTEDLLLATHAMMSNMAVTSLLNHADHMEQLYNEAVKLNTKNRTPDWRGSSFRGVGGLFMAPFFERISVDLEKVVNTISSKDKIADIRGFFIGLINELSYRMVAQTGYLTALRAISGDNKAKPKLLIGTDIYLPHFLFINGDDRIAGPEMDFDIAQTTDSRMENKIVLSFAGCAASGEMNILGHGNMLYIPELVATVPMLRGGNTVKETMVQPRFFFVEHLPVCAVIDVTNVDVLVRNRAKLDVNHYTV